MVINMMYQKNIPSGIITVDHAVIFTVPQMMNTNPNNAMRAVQIKLSDLINLFIIILF